MAASVVVLLSTYNGEKYINEQIDSIFNQEFDGIINVLIRDDGSSDETVNILRQCPQYRTGELMLNTAHNVGPQKSFLKLIQEVDDKYDYYFFSDQDDIWDDNKIKAAVDSLKTISTPAISCCNYRLTDSELNVVLERSIEQKPSFTPIRNLLYNEIPGCCMALNKPLMDKLKEIQIDNVMMHDSMALLLATYIGEVVYDETPRICHRIHGANVVGIGHKKIIPAKWIKEKWHLLRNGDDYDISKLAGEVLRVAGADGKQEYTKDLELLRDFKNSFGETLKLLRHPDTKGNPFDRTVMSIRSKILFHVF